MQPTQLIIIGITGDLAKRKLLPAIAHIASVNALPEQFKVIGISRRRITADDVLNELELPPMLKSSLKKHLVIHTMDLTKPTDYQQLNDTLKSFAAGVATQRLFYLSIPPQVTGSVVQRMGEAGLAGYPNTKLLLEKPFGTDLASAMELISATKRWFTEGQLYRIDHYLAKEMAQNILAFRTENPLFAHTWNNKYIDSIEITASEQIDIEGRATFYEQTGALRDFVQSHLLQLAALTIMDIHSAKNLQTSRLHALKDLEIQNVPSAVTRGQYEGYATEVNNPGSTVETFARITLFSKNKRWQGVPITLITGKALKQKITEINVRYKQAGTKEPNVLTFKIQPKEGIELLMWVKTPGFTDVLEQLPLRFTYNDHYKSLPEAYERVLVDAIRGDRTLFTSSDEVIAAWQIIEPVQHYWDMGAAPLVLYEKGAEASSIK